MQIFRVFTRVFLVRVTAWVWPVVLGAAVLTSVARAQTRVQPILGFPEAGLDDPAAYQGYQTRFYRDTKGNVVQIYLDARSGRVVSLLADAVDESVGFTVRDVAGKPVRLEWGSTDAVISQDSSRRTIEYQLVANTPQLVIGWILLGSMRVERDLGYSGRGLQPYNWPTFRVREEEDLISNMDRLDPAERQRQLGLLNTGFISDLRARLEPDIFTTGTFGTRGVTALKTTLDGENHLQLEIVPDARDATLTVSLPTVSIRALGNRPIRLTVRVTTDGPALDPLLRDQIFNASFLKFLSDARTAADRARANASRSARDAATLTRYRLLERDVRGTELLSSKQKLMAGLPNYATYFGRDMMMTSLMMQPIWTDAMPEFVIGSALRKLGPEGDVSHEEALGGQAIRENAAEYNAHMTEYFRLRGRSRSAADTALQNARALLNNLQKVRENYHMRDDEFQLPVVVARYLTNRAVSASRKRAFLLEASNGSGPRLNLLLKELGLVATLAAPYARDPNVQNLIASPRLDATHWRSISWRDSNAGYANGRFAMDINAIWVPQALRSIADIFSSLRALGFTQQQLSSRVPAGFGGSVLTDFMRDSTSLERAIQNWSGAVDHFAVTMAPAEIRTRVGQKLAWLPANERAYWRDVLAKTQADSSGLTFLAISLDSAGRPIPVVNTDPATWLLLRDASDVSPAAIAGVRRDVAAILRNYPVGLFADGLGPFVANDAYAPQSVWEAFKEDTYHSPRVVWGREVNLILLGLANQINGATDNAGRPNTPDLAEYVDEMKNALRRVNDAVEASGLKHNELWSFEIVNGQLRPIRYGASTDVQLWNVTDLAVQFVLSRLGAF
ncbi:MAG TPA: hypothetical protein VJ852_12630 [Gemmatimonadaceae bacterium]|nr:hypothetical protein [Gemmatimonadaceae bacterium]